jgi:hypothetical protein
MSCASPSDQVDGFTVFGRQLPLPSSFLRLGCPLFELAINLFDDITQNGNAGGEQASDQQRLHGGFENGPFAPVAELRSGIPWQVVMGNRNESSEFVQEHNLAGLVRSRHRFRVLDRRRFGRGGEHMTLRVNNSPIPPFNRHDVNRAASEGSFIDEHTLF